ncbi:MAG: hypothetical protein WD824_19570 [Cyclobacteriaceae bacterium]
MKPLEFECIWNKEATADIEQVKALWQKYQAIEGDQMIEKRVKQIVFIIKNEDEVCGVSTARPVQAKFLNGHFFYEFRCFIAPPFRAPGLDTLLAVKTKSFLSGLDESGTKFKGMLMIVENQELKNQRTKAIWPESEMVFAGYTPKGHHIRIGYFKGARI